MGPEAPKGDNLPSQRFRPGNLITSIRASESYGLVLLSIILSIGVTAADTGNIISRLLITFLLGGSLLLALWTAQARSRTLFLALFGLVAGLASVLLQTTLNPEQSLWLPETLNLLLIAVTSLAIARQLLTDQMIRRQTILGAICIYLLLGFFFADLYAILSLLPPRVVQLSFPQARLSDDLYFSFITLTTTGYGDITPTSGVARALAVTEALSGQLYLVTVIALLVGNFGKANIRERKKQ